MENKIKLSLSILITSALLLNSCENVKNPKERNYLVFKDSISSVSDSINALNQILLKTQNRGYIYAIAEGDTLSINDDIEFNYKKLRAGSLSDSLLHYNIKLNFIDSLYRKRFFKLVKYLNNNGLSRCDIENELPVYLYKWDISIVEFLKDLDRYVVYANSENEIDKSSYKIIDRKGNLFLLAHKNAKIWSD